MNPGVVSANEWCPIERGLPQPGKYVKVLMGSGAVRRDILVKSKYGYTFNFYSTKSETGIKAWAPISGVMECSNIPFEFT